MKNNVFRALMDYNNGDVQRINHAIKVYGFASAISISEDVPNVKKEIIEFAALLHDIGIKEAERKHNSSSAIYQEMEGPPVARAILQELGIADDIIDRICFLVGNHHSYQKIDDIDLQILVEADFIVNIFEAGMLSRRIDSIRREHFKTALGRYILDLMHFKQGEK